MKNDGGVQKYQFNFRQIHRVIRFEYFYQT